MATIYWVGGSGTWNTTSVTNWANASGSSGGVGGTGTVPTAADNVVFDQAGTYTVTMTGALNCSDITVSSGTVTFATGTSPTLGISGSVSIIAGTVWSSTGAITFNATTAKTISTNGITINASVTFNGVAGSWQLLSAFTTSSTSTVTLTNGTINLNNFTLTCGLFSSSGATARTLAFGTSGQLALTGNNGTILTLTTTTNLTTTGTLYINCLYTGATGTRTFSSGLTEAQAAGFSVATSGTSGIVLSPSATDIIALTGSFYTVDLTGFTGTLSNTARTIYGNLTIPATGGTYSGGFAITTFAATSGTKTITTNGRTLDFVLTFSGVGGTWQLQGALTVGSTRSITLNNGTLDLNNYTLTTGLFASSASTARTIAFGTGNITLNVNATNSIDISNATNLTITGTPIFQLTNATTNGAYLGTTPGYFTEANALSVYVGASTGAAGLYIPTTGSLVLSGNFKDINLTGFTGTIANIARTIYGNLTIPATGGTYSGGASATTFGATSGTKTITTNGRALDFPITFNGVGGTWQLQDALTVGITRTTTLTSGTISLNNFTLTTGLFSSTVTTARTIAFGTGNITVTGNSLISLDIGNGTALTITGTPIFQVTNSTSSGIYLGTTPGYFTEANSLSLFVGASTGAAGVYVSNTTTLALNGNFKNVDFTGFTGSVNNAVRTIYGNLTVPASGTTFVAGGSGTTFASTSGTKTITANGITLDFPIFFNGVGGTWQLSGAFTVGSARTTTLTNGTLDLNNYTFTTGLFSSSGSTARVIAFGTTGQLALAGNNATILDLSTITNFSTTGAVYINSTYTGATGTRTFSMASGASGSRFDVLVGGTSGIVLSSIATDIVALTGSFNSVNLTGFTGTLSNTTRSIYSDFIIPSSGGTFSSGSSITTLSGSAGTKSFNTNGRVLDFPITIDSSGRIWQLSGSSSIGSTRTFTLTAGTLDLNNYTLTTGLFVSSNSITRAIAFGTSGQLALTGNGVTVFDLTTATNLTITGTSYINSTYTGATGTRTFSLITAITEAQANANFNVSIGGTSGIVLSSTATDIVALTGNFGSVDLTGFTGTLSNTARTIYGSLTTPASGGTYTAGATATTFAATSDTKTITTNGRTLDFPVTFNGVGGTWRLIGAFTIGSTRTTTLTAGTLDLNNYTFTTGLFVSSGSTARTIVFGTGNITVNGTGTIWNTSTVSSMTTTGTPVVNVANNTATATTITPGNLSEANAISFNFTTGTYSLTFLSTASNTAKNVDFTGFAGTWTVTSSSALIYGNLTISSGMTLAASTIAFKFAGTSGTKTITSNGKTLDFPLIFDGVGSTWQLQDNLTVGSTRTTTITNGTLNLNNLVFSTGLFSSSTTAARTIAFGTSGQLALSGSSATILDITTATNLTITGTSYINCTYTGSTGTRTFVTGVSESQSVNFSVSISGTSGIVLSPSATDIIALTGNFGSLNLTNFTGTLSNTARKFYGDITIPSSGGTLASGSNITTLGGTSGTSLIYTNGRTINFPITIGTTGTENSATKTWQLQDAITLSNTFTLNAGTIDLQSYTLTTNLFSSDNSDARTIAFGTGNITLTTNASTTIWNTTNITNLTTTGSRIINASVNLTAAYSVSVITGLLPNESLCSFNFTVGSYTLNFLNSGIAAGAGVLNVDFTGFSGKWGYWGTDQTQIKGDITFSPTMSINGIANVPIYLTGTNRTQNIKTNGFILPFYIHFIGSGATYKLLDALTIDTSIGAYYGNGWSLILWDGTLDLNGYTMTTNVFQVSARVNATPSINFNGGNLVATVSSNLYSNSPQPLYGGAYVTPFRNTASNLTITGSGTLTFTNPNFKDCYTGGANFGSVILKNAGGGTLNVYGSASWGDIQASSPPAASTKFVFESGTTQTVKTFTLAGVAGNLVEIAASASYFYISSSGSYELIPGVIQTDYLRINSSRAIGGAAWYAGTHSVDLGSNTGWIFSVPGANKGSMFLVL